MPKNVNIIGLSSVLTFTLKPAHETGQRNNEAEKRIIDRLQNVHDRRNDKSDKTIVHMTALQRPTRDYPARTP
jgi:hypothetical protein